MGASPPICSHAISQVPEGSACLAKSQPLRCATVRPRNGKSSQKKKKRVVRIRTAERVSHLCQQNEIRYVGTVCSSAVILFYQVLRSLLLWCYFFLLRSVCSCCFRCPVIVDSSLLGLNTLDERLGGRLGALPALILPVARSRAPFLLSCPQPFCVSLPLILLPLSLPQKFASHLELRDRYHHL